VDYSYFNSKFILLVSIERNTTRDYNSLRIQHLSEQKIKYTEVNGKATLYLQVVDVVASVLFSLC